MKFTVKKDGNLLDVLMVQIGYNSKSKVKKLLKYSKVLINGEQLKRGDAPVTSGQLIEIIKIEKKVQEKIEKEPFKFLYEDEDIIIVEKPAGLLTVGIEGRKLKNLFDILSRFITLRSNGEDKLFLVHRLERDMSGIIVLAKSYEAKNDLQKEWKDCEQRYYALIKGNMPEKQGQLNNYLQLNKEGKAYATNDPSKGKEAITSYEVMKEFANHSILRLSPITSVKEQIRAQLHSNKTPIVGDKKYHEKDNPINRLGLHLFSLQFNHPLTGKEIFVKTPMPKIFLTYGKHKS